MTKPDTLTPAKLEEARKTFEEHEPSDLFYRAATELVELALAGKTSLSVAESVAVLLHTWNRMFYRYRRFHNDHVDAIKCLIATHEKALRQFRERSIESAGDEDECDVKQVFKAFEKELGPVGAAKCLHLLAPRFFPLWDRAIAKTYGSSLDTKGEPAGKYWAFLQTTKKQIEALGGAQGIGRNPLKAIDEYNYCKYTKRWM